MQWEAKRRVEKGFEIATVAVMIAAEAAVDLTEAAEMTAEGKAGAN